MVENPSCPICSSKSTKLISSVRDVEYWTSENVFLYYSCRECEILFLKDPPVDKLAEIYPDSYYSTDHNTAERNFLFFFLNNIKSILDKAFFKKNLKLINNKSTISCLDVGGGSGWMMNIIKSSDKRIKDTSVLDLNQKSKYMAEKNGHTFYCQNIDSIDFKEMFDVVVLFNLIEHVHNPKRTLSLIYNSLSSDGIAIIKTPNSTSFNRFLFEKFYWGGFHAPRHWVIFNEKNLRKLVEDIGFRVEKITYTQGAPQWSASLLGTFSSNIYRKKIMHLRPIYTFFLLLFSILDFLLIPLKRTDQMFFIIKKPSR